MSDEVVKVSAPRSLVHNGNSYYRIGSTAFPAIYYCAENNLALSLSFKEEMQGFKEEIQEIDFQAMFKNKLFNPLTEKRVYYSNDVRFGSIMMSIVIRRLSFLKLKNKHIMKKVKGVRHTIIMFKTPEDLTQFKFYFSDFYVGE
jgi:hypothetical protein